MPVTMPRSASLVKPKTSAEVLQEQCRMVGLPVPTLEFRFHPVRRWRWDCGWSFGDADRRTEPILLAVEIDGGVFRRDTLGAVAGGRHNRGAGYRADCEKHAEGAILGWRLIRGLPEDVKSGKLLSLVERFFAARGITPTGARRR